MSRTERIVCVAMAAIALTLTVSMVLGDREPLVFHAIVGGTIGITLRYLANPWIDRGTR